MEKFNHRTEDRTKTFRVKCVRTNTHARAHTHSHIYTHMHTHTHICTHTQIYTHPHSYIHKHTKKDLYIFRAIQTNDNLQNVI